MFRQYYEYERIKGSTREKISLIPEEAFREAVASALVHRTWDIDSHVNIAMFQDRIRITSPGGLPRGVSEEEYLRGGISILRNPIIGNVFYRLYIRLLKAPSDAGAFSTGNNTNDRSGKGKTLKH